MDSRQVVISHASKGDSRILAELMVTAFEADKTSEIVKLLFPPLTPIEREKRDQDNTTGICQIITLGKQKIIKAEIGEHIVGFAMWIPSEQDWLPAPSRNGFAARYHRQLIKTRKRIVGGTRYWYLALLAVDPGYWHRSIGSKLVQWGLDCADEDDGVKCCYVESSLMAEPLYASLGFKTIGWDCIKERDAKGGVIEWPDMIRWQL